MPWESHQPSMWRPGFNPSPVQVKFVVNKLELEKGFYPSFPCQNHATSAPYTYFCHLPLTSLNLSNCKCHWTITTPLQTLFLLMLFAPISSARIETMSIQAFMPKDHSHSCGLVHRLHVQK